MKTDIVAAVLLVVLGLVLAAISIPYISDNAVLGVIGVIGGVLMALSAIKPLLSARAKRAQRVR